MPELTTDELTVALAVVGGVALVSLLTSLILLVRFRRVRRDYRVIRGEARDQDVIATLDSTLGHMKELRRKVTEVVTNQEDLATIGRLSLQRFALVRYDAFEDMGGQLSFSAALLDDFGDGLVITSINGRTETRTYAKPIKNLNSRHNLSDEEREVIATAAEGGDRGQTQAQPSRSR